MATSECSYSAQRSLEVTDTQPLIKPADSKHGEEVARRQCAPSSQKTKHITSLPAVIITRPFRSIRQVWRDYQDGRNTRKRKPRERVSPTPIGDDHHAEADNKTSTQPDFDNRTRAASTDQGYHVNPLARQNGPLRPRPVVEYWVHQGGPYPWRLEQVVHRDPSDNLRGIWVLEVKDMHAVYWDRGDPPTGCIPPQPHWPFPRRREDKSENDSGDNEPDELLEWLRREQAA
ncbi:hypothetical protein F5X97DRAFT_339559 [Nemania serpens]|nr:hypothetical protein F5X97DRAFT_339559 [Nemania serpens]